MIFFICIMLVMSSGLMMLYTIGEPMSHQHEEDIRITRWVRKDSIKPFVVFTPQRKGFLMWDAYHYIDFCQDFKYAYEREADYDEYDNVLQELIDYLPELDKISIKRGGVL